MSKKQPIIVPFITLQNADAGVPLYRRVYETLRDAILSGQLSANSKLPSTRALARQLAVSRMTVVAAYEQLYAEGYVEGVSGSGTYIAAVLPEEMLAAKSDKRAEKSAKTTGGEPTLSKIGGRLKTVDHGNLRASRIQGKLSAFQYGLPAMDEFPFDLWARLVARRLKKIDITMFGSGDPAGYAPLREAVAAYLQTARAVRCRPEQVLIVNGAQQALAMTAQILIDENEIVWMEDPCYPGLKNAFAAAGANIAFVRIDKEGFNLPLAIEKNRRARLVCVSPSHQFPLGMVMSLSRRLALIEWARANDAWIIEDDYDSEFRYSGRPLASLQGLDRDGRVIYVGTFSKTIFPALRLGYAVVPENLIDVFTTARALADSHSPSIDQAVLTDFIADGHFARHVRKMRLLYEERQEILVSTARKYLAGLLDVTPDEAGMHLIGWLPENVSDTIAAEKAAAHGVQTKPLSLYSAETKLNGLILGYTAFTKGQIRNGIERLAKALT